jgi:hypothetical protein
LAAEVIVQAASVEAAVVCVHLVVADTAMVEGDNLN